MAEIGIWIETENGQVKETNFGVITAARKQGDHGLTALVTDPAADGLETVLGEYGVTRILKIAGPGIDLSKVPDVLARALADTLARHGLQALFGPASAEGGIFLHGSRPSWTCPLPWTAWPWISRQRP